MSLCHFETPPFHKLLFFMCAESLSSGPLTYRAHWAGCGLMPPLFHCLGAGLRLLFQGFVAKQTCLVLWLSKPTFLSNRYLTGLPYIFYLQSPLGAEYWITYPHQHYSCNLILSLVQLLSHVQLWDPRGCSAPGFPVLHYLPEFAQTHACWVGGVSSYYANSCAASSPQAFPSISPRFCRCFWSY